MHSCCQKSLAAALLGKARLGCCTFDASIHLFSAVSERGRGVKDHQPANNPSVYQSIIFYEANFLVCPSISKPWSKALVMYGIQET